MNYAELTENIQAITEQTFSADQLAMFTKQAEQKIYQSIQLPVQRTNDSGTLTPSSPYYTFPTDMLYVYAFAVVDSTGAYTYLNNVDQSFVREAYPSPTTTGLPRYYGFYDSTQFILAPTPDDDYTVELQYGYYPESIVDAGTTWLGDNGDAALLNGALIEACRFMKEEQDIVAQYEKLFVQSMALLKTLADGRMRQDTYRVGQVKVPVN